MASINDSSRVLVTGASGLIGSALIWALNQRGCTNIIASDVLDTSEKWRNLVPLQFDDYLESDQILDRFVSGGLENFDFIFHLGACSATTEKDASYLIRNNYQYTQALCRWAVTQGSRFVYASSAATYGDGEQGMSDTDSNLQKLRPLNMYGYSKHLFDQFADRSGILDAIVGLKYFNVYGPNEAHKGDMRSVVAKAFEQITATGTLSLFKSYKPEYPDGGQQRDFLYVKDAVAMTIHLAESEDAGGLYNLGSGEARSWLDLAHAVFAAMDREPEIQFIDMPDHLREKYQYFTKADISKLKQSGYAQPITPLGDAVADYVKSYLIPDHRLGDETGA